MRAVYLSAPQTIQLIDRPALQPKAGEVVVRIVAAGICATDLSLIEGDNSIGIFPMIPGHECVGRVELVGPGVALEPGTWVTVYPSLGCGQCCACQEGRINHCPTFLVQGIDCGAGSFAEQMLVQAQQVLRVPEPLQHAGGALIEPVAVAVHVNRRGQTGPGSRVAVIGAGVIGLLTAQVARAQGAARVALLDRWEQRRAVCASLGFEEFLCRTEDAALASLAADWGADFDVAFDTVCSTATIQAGLSLLSPGGTLVLVATPRAGTAFAVDFPLLYRRELSLVVSRNYRPQDFLDAMVLIERSQVVLDPLITGHFPLEAFGQAVEALRRCPEQHLKILIHPPTPSPKGLS